LVLVPVPSALLLAERPKGAPGWVVLASADGSRPLLVEVQALVAPAAAGFGRRTAAGVDGNRVSLLLAVLAQRAGCDVLDRDVFVNVAGGIRVNEPAIGDIQMGSTETRPTICFNGATTSRPW
jgi:DNA repair protein RadA/Sms